MKRKWTYAIGEIFIVIIGISIAFALNNWKDHYKDNQQKKQYLDNIVLDLEEERLQLQENQTQIGKKLELIKDIKIHLGVKKEGRDTIVRKVFDLGRLINFNPENTTYQTLINSGDMKLIDDFELRRSIEKHYSLHKSIISNYKRIEKINEKYLADFFIYELDYSEIYKGNIDFLDNPLLRNIITSIQGAYYLVLKSNEEGIKSIQTLLDKIEETER